MQKSCLFAGLWISLVTYMANAAAGTSVLAAEIQVNSSPLGPSTNIDTLAIDYSRLRVTAASVLPAAGLVAAVLPGSRSVQLGGTASAFATLINAGTTEATSCDITPLSGVPGGFVYQTTDPATNALTGRPDTPVDIAAGGLQTYVFAFTPTVALAPTEIPLSYDCTNTDPAPVVPGLNTLLLSSSSTPVPDIVALAATPNGDGVVILPDSLGANAFAVATVNVGIGGTMRAMADTGTTSLPVNLFICESNPATGECLSAPSSSVTTAINAGATPTFSIFVNGNGIVSEDPAGNRIFVRFRDAAGVTRGSTSVAVQTLVSASIASCDAQTGGGVPTIQLVRAFPNLQFSEPVALLSAASNDRFFMVEKAGRIVSFVNDDAVSATTSFVDLTSRIDARGEGGLLGMAFDPDVASNDFVYLSYTTSDDPLNDNGSNFRSVVSRFSLNTAGNALDTASEQILLTLPQAFANHNGGQLGFGPDGFLYIGFGDEGSGGDPSDNGQNPANFYGSMLRIDVTQPDAARGLPYSIPASNPNAGNLACSDGACPEVFAFGLRNPWRWSFDRLSGDLWAGDVGQGEWEEIDRIEAGGNYGWRCLEASQPFNFLNCDNRTFQAPVAEYSHSEGQSVTGGYVYRGASVGSLAGTYLFGDFVTGRIWGLFAPYSNTPDCRLLTDTGLNISSFAEDTTGEVFVIAFSGELYRISP